ncbi:3',5'-cyclic adenosine monophosphate phosphodiesterase CpdA [Arenibacter antarcticus]|uniref:Metallophosphoesterase n=1 Tax=Arenibacter antarcticus TaxID=2040469 RepID=A0ABW5VHG6_9FLAO|nr:metallophosphoesterase [Arenibacter sp. H213]MCM4166877.1 phosphoesterase [Arenibacter sp. H213]
MNKLVVPIILLLLFWSCATTKSKYRIGGDNYDVSTTKEISHTFYLIGDAGLSPINGMNPALKIFRDQLNNAPKNSTAIFLGDNIYPAGLPDPKDSTVAYRQAKSHLDAQLATLSEFKGNPIFIPGNHDWYNDGLKGLERQQKYIQEKLGSKEVFFPEDGCPIEKVEIDDNIVLIAIDTEWYLTNWDRHPTINDECEIKDRETFFEELESLIKKNRDKTTILALHHPMFSYGPHGGQFSMKMNLNPSGGKYPFPILGSLVNLLRKTSGASITDLQNKRYLELKNRLVTLAQYSEKVIFTSGHEHSLQYIVEDNTPQIVSGSGGKEGATRLLNGAKFSTGRIGFAKLEVYTDGSSEVRYFGVDQNYESELLFASEVLPPDRNKNYVLNGEDFPKEVRASVYTKEDIDKSIFFKTIWGERYRKYYGTEVTAPTLKLDTLFGGLKPVRKGGGNQSKSLRLSDSNGKEYVIRAVKKSAEVYLQAMAFKDKYVIGEFKDTYTEAFLMDFYTGALPYGLLTVGTLSDAIELYHTNPRLYFIPKQIALEEFNEEFGDELYFLEEHVGDGHGALESFGYANKIESTLDMLDKIRRDEKYEVDTDRYLRTRLFDMVLGDWDRHDDQWRWGEVANKETGKIIFEAIPRDRDQVYSIWGDGALMNVVTRIVPALKMMEGFNSDIRNVEAFNKNAYGLDMTLLSPTTKADWERQVQFIQENLTPEVIDEAFTFMPKEILDEEILNLKSILLSRIQNLPKIADDYFLALNKFVIIKGTDKDDWFEINNVSKKEIEIKVFRNIGGEKKKLFYQKTFNSAITKEIWVYGLDDTDIFEIRGSENNQIKLRLIGGQNNDIYDISGGDNIWIYDHKAKKNTFNNIARAKLRLTNDYETNTFQPLKTRNSTQQIVPSIGYNPDDGVKLGFNATNTFYGFRQNPFTHRQTYTAAYYFATNGFELGYNGEFAHVFENWNLELAARFTSPNFSVNFYGIGNDTDNFDDTLGMDYNRVRIEQLTFSPSLVWRGQLGAKFKTGLSLESLEVEETENRFINTYYQANGEENRNNFLGVNASYSYENLDNNAFPTMGMSTELLIGYKTSLENAEQHYGYIVPSLAFDYKLVSDGRLVLATKWKAHFNLGEEYEFYQAASIGGVDGLRGYRNQRFSGKTSYYQNTDLRYSLKKLKTGLLPVTMGIYGGFDYGRVWTSGEYSDLWHTSYGGGLFFNGADVLTARLALFTSEEGTRITFGVGFGF